MPGSVYPLPIDSVIFGSTSLPGIERRNHDVSDKDGNSAEDAVKDPFI